MILGLGDKFVLGVVLRSGIGFTSFSLCTGFLEEWRDLAVDSEGRPTIGLAGVLC